MLNCDGSKGEDQLKSRKRSSSEINNDFTPKSSRMVITSRGNIQKFFIFTFQPNQFIATTDQQQQIVQCSVDTPLPSTSIDSNQDQLTTKNSKRRLCFPGNLNDDIDLTPKSSKKYISTLRNTVVKQRRKIKNSCQKIRRQQRRIASLKGLLEDLRDKNLVSDNAVELLQVKSRSRHFNDLICVDCVYSVNCRCQICTVKHVSCVVSYRLVCLQESTMCIVLNVIVGILDSLQHPKIWECRCRSTYIDYN